ncbi:STY13 [Symbiodinium natans]|uniref:STY13 protein n=1 Tax=Symbiodinium natans TaxID=878477 RepID=A0A812JHP8_9DINO|nr:STY13 [Symbiodinium natans]
MFLWCCMEKSPESPRGFTIVQGQLAAGAEETPQISRQNSQDSVISVNSVNAMPDLDEEARRLKSPMGTSGEASTVDSDTAATQPSSEPQQASSGLNSTNRTRLLGRAADSRWKLRKEELHMQRELSRTLKSSLYLATWKGTEVVMKCVEVPQNFDRSSGFQRKISQESYDPGASRALYASEVKQDLLDELLHEIELLSSLRHPDLVLFIGACLDKDSPVMCVTEYMPGGDLERHFMAMRRKHQTLWRPTFRQVLDWSSSIARALTFLHTREEPIIHRDLKPLNLLLTKHGEVKVADLGISKMMAAVAGDVYDMTGGVGSWLYMAPEVVRHRQYNEKVDIYAFALIMYFMSSGHHPFHQISKDPEVVLRELAQGREPRPNAAECHPPLRALMAGSWHVDQEQRPSAQQIAVQLREAADSYTPSTCLCTRA